MMSHQRLLLVTVACSLLVRGVAVAGADAPDAGRDRRPWPLLALIGPPDAVAAQSLASARLWRQGIDPTKLPQLKRDVPCDDDKRTVRAAGKRPVMR